MGITYKVQSSLRRILPESVRPYKTILLKWMLFGGLVRVLLMPIFASGDLLSISSWSFFLKVNHQLILSNDSPFIFYLQTFMYTIFGPLLPSRVFSDILSNTVYTPVGLSSLFRISSPGILAFITVSKIPYLFFDFATALLLLHLVNDGRKAVQAFKLWILSPVSLFVSYAIGQYDIIAVFFVMLALYFFAKNKTILAMLSLSVSSAIKMFGIFLIPPMILIIIKRSTNARAKAKILLLLLAIGSLPFILTQISLAVTPKVYESVNAALPHNDEFNGYFGKTFYSRGVPQPPFLQGLFTIALNYSTSLKTYILLGDVIYIFFLVYGLLLLTIIWQDNWPLEKVWKAFLVIFLAYYAVALFLPQWFLWAQPLLVLLVLKERRFLKLYLISLPLFFVYTWYWNQSLTSNLLAPAFNQAYFWPGPIDLMNNIGLPGIQVVNVFRSLLSAVCIFIAVVIAMSGARANLPRISFWRVEEEDKKE